MNRQGAVRWEEVPEHVKDTMCRILLAAIQREKDGENRRAG